MIFFKNAKKDNKINKCPICGTDNPVLCNSHSVPRFILENIADKGIVDYYLGIIESGIEKENLGVNQAGCFKIICRNCDSSIFKDYEDENILLNFSEPQKIMRGIALKNVLRNTYGQLDQLDIYLSLLEKKKVPQKDIDKIKEYLLGSWIDLEYYRREMNRISDIISGDDASEFKIIYHHLLPYIVPIAFQGCFAINQENHQSDSYNLKTGELILQKEFIPLLHIAVFPLSEFSLVLMFAMEKEFKDDDFWRFFKAKSDSDKMKIINLFILKFSDNYFLSRKINFQAFNPDFISICKQQAFFNPSQLTEIDIYKEMNICPNFIEMNLKNL